MEVQIVPKRRAAVRRTERASKRRAQESVGFMMIIGGAVFLFLIFSGIMIKDADTAVNIELLTNIRSNNDKLSRAIYRSYMNGPGSSESIILEGVQEDYITSIIPGNIITSYEKGSNTNPTRAYKVFETEVSAGWVLIKNQEGWINVTQI